MEILKELVILTKIVCDKTTGRAISYLGRDGKTYPLNRDNVIIVVHDDPDGGYPYSVFILRNGIISLASHVDSIDNLMINREVFKLSENGELKSVH